MVQKLWRFKVEVRVKLVSISRAVLPKLLSRVLIIDLERILITAPRRGNVRPALHVCSDLHRDGGVSPHLPRPHLLPGEEQE